MSASDLADRLDAVERALTDDETDLTDVRTAATLHDDLERLERRVADLEETVEELDAAVDAVRGYAGNVRAVNREVERRASAALAKAEALEAAVDPAATPDRSDAAASTDPNPAERGQRAPRRPADEVPDRDEARPRHRSDAGTGSTTAGGAARDGGGSDSRRSPSGDGGAPGSDALSGGDGGRREGLREDHGHHRGDADRRDDQSSGRPGTDRGTGSDSRIGRSTGGPGNGRSPDTGGGRRSGSGTDDGDDGASNTEQFIERVRDAL